MRLRFNLAPPLLAPRDPKTGLPRKMEFGPWMLHAFRLLARFKGLRGTRLDPFGWTEERRMERRLIGEYRSMVEGLLPTLSPANHATATTSIFSSRATGTKAASASARSSRSLPPSSPSGLR